MKRLYTVDEIKKIVGPIARSHDVDRMYLFGSYARGEAKPESDIDLRIEDGSIQGLFHLCSLHVDLEDALKLRVDLLSSGGLSDRFKKEIEGEEVLIYDRK